MSIGDIDSWRKGHLAIAEWIDAWRVIPRLLVAGYGYLVWMVVHWYMNLKPALIDKCDVELLGQTCITEAPSTQHAALVTAVVGMAAVVIGLYVNSGRKWNGFTKWNGEAPKTEGVLLEQGSEGS